MRLSFTLEELRRARRLHRYLQANRGAEKAKNGLQSGQNRLQQRVEEAVSSFFCALRLAFQAVEPHRHPEFGW